MMKLFCGAFYIVFFIPFWALSKIVGCGRFSKQFHGRKSVWDYDINQRK